MEPLILKNITQHGNPSPTWLQLHSCEKISFPRLRGDRWQPSRLPLCSASSRTVDAVAIVTAAYAWAVQAALPASSTLTLHAGLPHIHHSLLAFQTSPCFFSFAPPKWPFAYQKDTNRTWCAQPDMFSFFAHPVKCVAEEGILQEMFGSPNLHVNKWRHSY